MIDEAAIPTRPTAFASAVSLKLPDFWPSDPELWFAQAEALFAAQNITQEKTKFGHVVRVLPAQYASEVRDIILRPPEAPYTALKTELQNRVFPSKRQRLQLERTRNETEQQLSKNYKILIYNGIMQN